MPHHPNPPLATGHPAPTASSAPMHTGYQPPPMPTIGPGPDGGHWGRLVPSVHRGAACCGGRVSGGQRRVRVVGHLLSFGDR